MMMNRWVLIVQDFICENEFNLEGRLTESFCLQLIISVTFSQAVKLHSIKVKAPCENGPKSLRLFINQPNTIDFSSAASYQPVQELE